MNAILADIKSTGCEVLAVRGADITPDGKLDGKPWPLRVFELASTIVRRRRASITP